MEALKIQRRDRLVNAVVRQRQVTTMPEKIVSSSTVGHGVIVLVSMSTNDATSGRRTSMRKLRNCTTSSLKRWFRLPLWSRFDPSWTQAYTDEVYLGAKDPDEKVAELHFFCTRCAAHRPYSGTSSLHRCQKILKDLSRLGTTVIEMQGSAEGVVAGSVPFQMSVWLPIRLPHMVTL